MCIYFTIELSNRDIKNCLEKKNIDLHKWYLKDFLRNLMQKILDYRETNYEVY